MKSQTQQLKNRGLLDYNKIKQYQQYTKQQLIALFNDDADVRTIAIHLLSKKFYEDHDFTLILLEQLKNETALYTKIEICDNLSLYGHPIVMSTYLGKVGNNQYKTIPTKVSLKKSYPLPRDLVARSLAHMNINHFNEFLSCLGNLPYNQLLEGIDALGFFCFYNQSFISKDIYCFIEECICHYSDNLLMLWKLMTCLSAFPQSIQLLNTLKQKQKHPTILLEIERSLHILQNQL